MIILYPVWFDTTGQNNIADEPRPGLDSAGPGSMHHSLYGNHGGHHRSSGMGSGGGVGNHSGGGSSGSHASQSMIVMPQPMKSSLGSSGTTNGGTGRKYQCKMCPQVSQLFATTLLHNQNMKRRGREEERRGRRMMCDLGVLKWNERRRGRWMDEGFAEREERERGRERETGDDSWVLFSSSSPPFLEVWELNPFSHNPLVLSFFPWWSWWTICTPWTLCIILKLDEWTPCSRYLDRRPTCSYTPRSTWERLSPTSVASVQRHLPTHPTCRNIPESIWESNRTDVRSARGNLPNCPICSSTSEPIQETNHINVVIQDVTKHSPSYPIFNPIQGVTRRINHLSVTPVTSVSRMRQPFWNIFQNIRNPNIWKLTFVNTAENHIRRKLIWLNIWQNMLIAWTRGLLPSSPGLLPLLLRLLLQPTTTITIMVHMILMDLDPGHLLLKITSLHRALKIALLTTCNILIILRGIQDIRVHLVSDWMIPPLDTRGHQN